MAGANVTAATTDVFVDFSTGSFAKLREVWASVDVVRTQLLFRKRRDAIEAAIFVAGPSGIVMIVVPPIPTHPWLHLLQPCFPTLVRHIK